MSIFYTSIINEEVLKTAYVNVFNTLVENKEYFLAKWQAEIANDDLLKKYRSKTFIEILESATPIEVFDENLCLMMLEHIRVEDGNNNLVVTLLDGTNMECKNKLE